VLGTFIVFANDRLETFIAFMMLARNSVALRDLRSLRRQVCIFQVEMKLSASTRINEDQDCSSLTILTFLYVRLACHP